MSTTKKSPPICTLAVTGMFMLLYPAYAVAQPGYFALKGCAGCHAAPVVETCNGCHAHGAHPDAGKNAIKVTGVTNKSSYAPGEMVTVTISGGYRTGWIRALLYDQNMVELARSTGNDSGMGSSASYPVTLSAPAPATPGTFSWKVAWYGNRFDAVGVTFGAGWAPDANNPNHGAEMVTITTPFVVASAPQQKPSKKVVNANSVAPEAALQRR